MGSGIGERVGDAHVKREPSHQFTTQVNTEYIAHHLKHEQGAEYLPAMLFLDQAYQMYHFESEKAKQILDLYQLDIRRDLKAGVTSLQKFKYRPLP